jgi:dolichyl-phosphate-mannose-protein mannosyltransferase
MKPRYILLLGCLACTYMSLAHLHNTYFWDDEAHVGIIAKNFLTTGHFTGWDGRNLFAFRDGTLLDARLRSINPPLEYLVTAASFRLFGASTWAGRFPFVIAGLLSLIVFIRLIHNILGKEIQFWGYAGGSLAFSTVFLLNIRQCRYYAFALLFSLLTYLSYRACLRTKHWGDFLALALWATLLFYSNHLLAGAFLLALMSVHGLLHRHDLSAREWGKGLFTLSLIAVTTLPYALYYEIWYRPDIPAREIWYIRKATLLWWNLRDLNLIGYFPWIAAVGGGFFLIHCRTQQTPVTRTTREWLILSLIYVACLALFSPQPTSTPTIADVRYLIPVLPFFTGVVGILLAALHEKMPAVAMTLFLVNVTTNIFTLTPLHGEFRWLLPAYLKEVHEDYPTAYRAVSEFLEHHAKRDDLVLAYPPHTNYPLMFYTGDTLLFCCLLNQHTQLPRPAVDTLQAPLFIEQHLPDWFIAFGNHPATTQLLTFFLQHPLNRGNRGLLSQFQLVEILDVYWRDTHRPELPWHTFGARTDFDRASEAVYIFKRAAHDTLAKDTAVEEKSSLPYMQHVDPSLKNRLD